MSRFAIAVALVAVLVSAGCGSALAPEALYAKSVDVMQSQPFHMDGKVDIALKDATSMSMSFALTMTGDVQPPDRFRGSVGATILGNSFKEEIVTVGGTTWTRQSGGAWISGKTTQTAPTVNAFVDAKYVKSTAELPAEDIDGRRARHLVVQFDLDKLGTQDPTGARTFLSLLGADPSSGAASLSLDHWVDVGTQAVRRQKVTMDVSGAKGTFDITILLDYTHLGEALQPPIEPPR